MSLVLHVYNLFDVGALWNQQKPNMLHRQNCILNMLILYSAKNEVICTESSSTCIFCMKFETWETKWLDVSHE